LKGEKEEEEERGGREVPNSSFYQEPISLINHSLDSSLDPF
jgi:hypothetical protein